MNKRVIDLTAEELERVATAAWNAAAAEALGKGLSVTGSHDGRLFRYFPDRRIENLGPVTPAGGVPVARDSQQVAGASAEGVVTPSLPSAPTLPGSVVADIQASFRDIAEKSLSQARENYEKMKSAAQEASSILEDAYETASKSATDYNQKVIEMARENANSTFDFAVELLRARTFSEVVELTAAHAQRQFETLAEQSKELAVLAQKVAIEAAGSIDAGTTDVRTTEHRAVSQKAATKN
jgi:phasin